MSHPDLLVGFDTVDDAAVYQIAPDQAIIQTLDFITPILDDPRQFGRVAAANSLSDVYAMGGRPITAMSITCFPIGDLDLDVLAEILCGACDAITAAGAVLAGGHTVDDPQLKFGLSVTGLVHPDRILMNSGAQIGDRLVLTKPLGTGIVTTGIKRAKASAAETEAVARSMMALNDSAAEAAQASEVHACTDVTGFGLAGHLHQMMRESGVMARLDSGALPLLPGARELARQGITTGGQRRNQAYVADYVDFSRAPEDIAAIAFDPQTSGGLLMAVPPSRVDALVADLKRRGTLAAAVIGECADGESGRLEFRG